MRRPLLLALAIACVVLSLDGAAAVGGDPAIPQQWGLAQIGARAAWDRGVIGSGSTVAIIDTGADLRHEDLPVSAAVTCIDTQGQAARCTTGGDDVVGHGSHVAGIAAAASNGVGIAGVAPGARLVVVRVFQEELDPLTRQPTGEYVAYSPDVAAAIRWVIANVREKGAINLSLGGDFVVTTIDGTGFEAQIEEAWKAGWVTVLSSGNENVLGVGGSSNYGALNAVIVGATGPDGKLAPYSSPFGNAKWGLVAPGGAAESSDPDRGACDMQPERCVLSTYKGGQYAFLQGTSMATPHVTGAVALLMGAGLTNSQAVERLLATANKATPCGSGCDGRLDVATATAGLGGGGGGGTPTPTTASTGGTSGGGTTGGGATATTVRRTPSGTPTSAATPQPASGPLPTETPSTLGTLTETSEPASSDALTGLSVDEAADAVDDRGSSSDRDLPIGVVLLAVVALAAVAALGVLRLRLARGGGAP